MRFGYFIDKLQGLDLDNIVNEAEIKDNLKTFTKYISSNAKELKFIALREETPFFRCQENGTSSLGYFDEELKDLGKALKQHEIRIVSIIDDNTIGLGSEETEKVKRAMKLLQAHVEFYELCHLDYNSLVFMGYGDKYLCDLHNFKRRYSILPTYIKHRLGSYDRTNMHSMFLHQHIAIPYIFNCNDKDNVNKLFLYSWNSFVNNSIQSTKSVITAKTKKDICDFCESIDLDILLLEEQYKPKKKLSKIRLKNGTATKLSRKTNSKNRKKKKISS